MTEQVAKERVARPRAAAKTPEEKIIAAALDARRSLFEALAWVAGQVGEVPKNGKNDHFGYRYSTKDDVITHLKPLLAKAGLIIVPRHVKTERSEPDEKGMRDLVTTWNMLIVHGPTGGNEQVPWESESMDNQDKGLAKSATSAMKQFYQHLFDIPSGDPTEDVEHNTNSAQDRSGGQRPTSSPRPSGSASVSTKTILDYKETHGLNWNQLSQAIEDAGGDGSAKVKDVPADLRPTILANLERIVAGGEVAAQEAQTAPDEGPHGSGDGFSVNPDDDIPF